MKSRFQTVTLQHCSIPCSAAESLNTVQPISQPFLNGLSWNFAWWLSMWKGSSLESKEWPCSTAVFHAALQNPWTLYNLYLSHISTDWAEISHDDSLGGKHQVLSQKSDPAESLNTPQPISKPFLNWLSWNFAWWLSRWKSQKSGPAALQYSMQHCRIPKYSTTYISANS